MQAAREISDLSHLHLSGISEPRSVVDNLSSKYHNIHNRRDLNSKLFDNPKYDFNFKYISESELEAIVKRVRRAKQKKIDEEEWKHFLRMRQERKNEKTEEESVCEQFPNGSENNCLECHFLESASNTPKITGSQHEEMLKEQEDTMAEELDKPVILEIANTNDNVSHTYQLGPGLTKRLQDLLSTVGKMTSLLLNPCLDSQYEDEDVDRTIKRSLEFDSMFARNHLYEIQRLLKGTKQVITGKSTNTGDLEGKISAALKCVTQALQVYTRHVSRGSRVKYQQVVPIFQAITRIQCLLEHLTGQHIFPMREEIDVSCSYMKQILLEIGASETKTVSAVSQKPPAPRHKHKLSADLSMYNHRRKVAWRKKAASLARARFGAPSAKKSQRKPGSVATKETAEERLKKGNVNTTDMTSKTVLPSKEQANSKEIPFRNATRAVPEEDITTMMEMIPHEPLDDSKLCLDDNAFQTLKLLNGASESLWEANIVDAQLQENPHIQPVSPTCASTLQSPDISANAKSKSLQRSMEDGDEGRNKMTSAKSSAREPNNVQLVCVKERTPRSDTSTIQVSEVNMAEDECKMLTVEPEVREEALEYHQKINDYHKSSQIYKDDKALGIVDRLANSILTEMILDFQRDEMDQVIQALYNLEFE